ncbi:hypothetical protein BKA62DRAFT_151344 [Auriculariales sp. MPI-PUGE-AT-0066]|nr:hypothetical protein BKA62DRAFT_151344 [Auriculariales sp. MPI-PUGE-AT-0066]
MVRAKDQNKSTTRQRASSVGETDKFSPEPSPPVEWGGDSDEEWDIEGVHDQFIDPTNPNSMFTKVAWRGWTDSNGRNTTWERPEASQAPSIWQFQAQKRTVKRHSRMQTSILRVYTPDNISIQYTGGPSGEDSDSDESVKEIQRPSAPAVRHQVPGQQQTAGRKRRRSTVDEDEDDSGHQGTDQESLRLLPRRRSSARSSEVTRSPFLGDGDRSSTASLKDSHRKASAIRPPLAVHPAPTSNATSVVSSFATRSSRTTSVEESRLVSSSSGQSGSTTSRTSRRVLGGRAELPTSWQQELADLDASPLTAWNDVNDEVFPKLPQGFQYLENRYLKENSVDQLFVVGCDCDSLDGRGSQCFVKGGCKCHELDDAWYTTQGHYRYNDLPGRPVRECTTVCHCSLDDCCNRVTQHPRKIPLQIFRTPDDRRGWGVRATERLHKGEVLGIYTGELLRRSEAARRPKTHQDYAFDLDFEDGAEDARRTDHERWTVVAYECGNWTRFLNHSCEPNLRVFPVFVDHPEIPKLAMYASRDIDPYTELVIDYTNARGMRGLDEDSDSGTPVVKSQRRRCLCSAKGCRKYF